MTEETPNRAQLQRLCAMSLERWRDELTVRLTPDDAWRLLLGSAMNALLAVGTAADAARVLREAAAALESGAPVEH